MLIALMIFAATGSSWAAPYSGGDGSDDNPYQIATAADLIYLSNNSGDWNQSFILTADITFDADEQLVDWDGDGSADWDTEDQKGFSPIGSFGQGFKGKFNGQGHKVSNLYINRTTQSFIGLFGYTYSNATIENIGIINCNITGNTEVGVLVGYNGGGATLATLIPRVRYQVIGMSAASLE